MSPARRDRAPARVTRRIVEYACPWFEVERKDVVVAGRGEEPYFSVKTEEYLAVLAVTQDGQVPFVRIYRPAVESICLELPSGRVEPGETIEAAGRRELLEETGCRASSIHRMGSLFTDTGRMQTRQVALFAPDAKTVGEPASPDEDIEVVFVPAPDVASLIESGALVAGAHIAVIALAWTKGLVER
jgi:ADP-ribose diphosphatase